MPKLIKIIKIIAPKIENPVKPITNIKRAERLFSLKEVFATDIRKIIALIFSVKRRAKSEKLKCKV